MKVHYSQPQVKAVDCTCMTTDWDSCFQVRGCYTSRAIEFEATTGKNTIRAMIKKYFNKFSSNTTFSGCMWRHELAVTGTRESPGDDRWNTLATLSFHDLIAEIFDSSWRNAGNFTSICEPSPTNCSSSVTWTPWFRRCNTRAARTSIKLGIRFNHRTAKPTAHNTHRRKLTKEEFKI